MRVTRIVIVIVVCIVAAHTALEGQLRGRVIHHAAAPASSVLALAIAVIKPALLRGLVRPAGATAGLHEAALRAGVRAVPANTAAVDAGQKVTAASPTRQPPQIRHARSPSAAQKTCETSACRARGALVARAPLDMKAWDCAPGLLLLSARLRWSAPTT